MEKSKPDKTKTTFLCPICKEEVEVGVWGKSTWPDEPQGTGSSKHTGENWENDPQSIRNMEYRLSNKRFHMRQHKEKRRELFRTARQMGGGSSFVREQCQDTNTGQNPSPLKQ